MWKQVPRPQAEQVFHIDVPRIGDILEITVVEPFPGAASAGRLFPTLYLLDARLTLDIVVGTKRLFDIFSGGALPLCYLVAIGYADPDIAARRFPAVLHIGAEVFGEHNQGRNCYVSFCLIEIA